MLILACVNAGHGPEMLHTQLSGHAHHSQLIRIWLVPPDGLAAPWKLPGCAYLCPSQSKCDSQFPEQEAKVACRFSTGRFWLEDEDVMDSAFVMAFVRPPRLLLSFCSSTGLQHKLRD